MARAVQAHDKLLAGCAAILALVFVWSWFGAHDRFTWWLEAIPAIIAVILLAATVNSFPLTPLAYILVTIHSIILLVGAHYTYALVPLFDWIRDAFGFSRNHYDRLGHFAQGFVPAIIARELLIRTSPLRPSRWLFAIVTLSCLGISAAYELIEWFAAITTGEAATAFLGTQGDPFDTQADMAMALIGAITAQLLLSRLHDRQLAALAGKRSSVK
ncbi:MAG TPA: DUF2238 domain-containing protein [Rhizobiales bacterium]|nr:DUF2238 domain-containing protein [Hyphomicrobiales bacterium]